MNKDLITTGVSSFYTQYTTIVNKDNVLVLYSLHR